MLPLPCGPPWAQGSSVDSRIVFDVCLLRTTSVLAQNNGSRVEFLATRFLFLSRHPTFISPPSCVAVGAPPHRTGQALSDRMVTILSLSAHVARWPARTAIAS